VADRRFGTYVVLALVTLPAGLALSRPRPDLLE
jgi:hypothetical protein